MEHIEYRHEWRRIIRAVFIAFLITLLFGFGARVITHGFPDVVSFVRPHSHIGSVAASVPSPFTYSFHVDGTLQEAGVADESTSPYWWLDSGGKLIIENDVGKTVQGAIPAFDRWRVRYGVANADDTGGGYYPQNLFRLLTRSTWGNARVEADFRIKGDNFTKSPNRNESNGLLLMSRYRDENNLYYAGIRVDGHAVIKKKIDGTYYTMAEKKIFDGTYTNGAEINLLPHDEWFSLRMETVARNDTVTVRLFMKRKDEKDWQPLLTATDDGQKFGTTQSLTDTGHLGIRTDFMDVEFDNFRAEKI